jgi:hypothetical protein
MHAGWWRLRYSLNTSGFWLTYIKVGKAADLALVAGDPSVRIGDLRQTRTIMLDGGLLDADALRTAAGFSGRPK